MGFETGVLFLRLRDKPLQKYSPLLILINNSALIFFALCLLNSTRNEGKQFLFLISKTKLICNQCLYTSYDNIHVHYNNQGGSHHQHNDP